MRTLKFIVDKQLILKDPDCDFSGLIPGTDEWLKAEFSFSAEWDGFAKTISFWSPLGMPYPQCALQNDGVCLIPEEATKMRIFKISVKGTKGEATLTTNKIAIIQDDDIPEVSEDDTVVSSLIARVSKLDSKVEDQAQGLSTETDRATKVEAELQDNITTIDNKIDILNEEVDGKQPAGDYALKNDITVKDVQIDGASILSEGVANVPAASKQVAGVVKTDDYSIGLTSKGALFLYGARNGDTDARSGNIAIAPSGLDYAVTAAMCDGKGPAWTVAQQAAARERIGIPGNFALIEEITITEAVASFARESAPDGTPYSLAGFLCVITSPGVASAIALSQVVYAGTTQFYNYGVRAVDAAENAKSVLFACVNNAVLHVEQYPVAMQYELANAPRIGKKFVPDGSPITKVTFSGNIPANTKITIYGVRA